ncbi:MAG: hypothetical protein SFW36_11595, partial [Leptolyngbyaceae cyanobacterium bins.59]|nr:hypothetical protein [Leptolyngbyaceae cyanobacterium bins.59]
MSNHSKSKVNQARFQILVFTLTIAVFVTTLFPKFARAGILDGLSNTVQQTMGQVTGTINNAINTPIQQVETVLGDVQDGVMQPVNNVLGDLNRTLSSLLAPFQQQLQQYFQVFTQTFQQILKDVMGTIGDVFSGSDIPWNEQWGHNSDGADHTGGSSSGGSLDQALEMPIVTGSLGLPDFIRNHQALYEQAIRNTRQGTPAQAMRSHDRFNINPLPLAQSMQFMQDRAQNNGMAATILSSEGQAALRQEMQG